MEPVLSHGTWRATGNWDVPSPEYQSRPNLARILEPCLSNASIYSVVEKFIYRNGYVRTGCSQKNCAKILKPERYSPTPPLGVQLLTLPLSYGGSIESNPVMHDQSSSLHGCPEQAEHPINTSEQHTQPNPSHAHNIPDTR